MHYIHTIAIKSLSPFYVQSPENLLPRSRCFVTPMTHSRDTEQAWHLYTDAKPKSIAQWSLHLQNCQTVRHIAKAGLRIPYRSHSFWVPPIIGYLLRVHEPGLRLLKVIRLIRGLHLARSIPERCNWEGQLSDLDTEENILRDLIDHTRNTVGFNNDGLRSLLRSLYKDLDDFRYLGLYMTPHQGMRAPML